MSEEIEREMSEKSNDPAACSDSDRRLNVTTDEAIELLLSWANRIEELADRLEEVRFLEVRKQDDLRSGIQERAQCMIDLLCLLSGRGVQ